MQSGERRKREECTESEPEECSENEPEECTEKERGESGRGESETKASERGESERGESKQGESTSRGRTLPPSPSLRLRDIAGRAVPTVCADVERLCTRLKLQNRALKVHHPFFSRSI